MKGNSPYRGFDQRLVDGYTTIYICHRPGTGRAPASKEARRDVNDTSTIIDDGEKVEKRSETSAMCTTLAELRRMVDSVPADRRRLVTEALPTSEKLQTSAD